MQIRKTLGKPNLQRGRWLIHGPGKIGKSTFASGFPNNLFLATERRLDHIKDIEYVFVDSWEEFKKIVSELASPAYQRRYEVVTIDVIDNIWVYCVEHVCKRLGIEHQSEESFGKAWDMIDSEFKKTFYKLLSYPYGILIISHSKNETIQTLKGSRNRFVSTLPERARRIIVPHMGVVGYIDYDLFPVVRNGKERWEECRVITFQGNDAVEAGDGEGMLPPKIRLYRDARKTYDIIKRYYDGQGTKKEVMQSVS